jgi:hypothetical protein
MSQGHDFPEKYPKSPDIRLGREYSVNERLGSHPPNREQSLSLLPVVVIPINVSCKTKVPNLHNPLIDIILFCGTKMDDSNETVPSRQVPMDKVELFKVHATPCHVETHSQEVI